MADDADRRPENLKSAIDRALRQASASTGLKAGIAAGIDEHSKLAIGSAMQAVQPMQLTTAGHMLETSSAVAKALEGIKPLSFQHTDLSSFAAARVAIDPQVLAAIRGMPSLTMDPALVGAIGAAQQAIRASLASAAQVQPFLKQMMEQKSTLQNSIFASVQALDVARTTQWMRNLARTDKQAIDSVLGTTLSPAIAQMRETIARSMSGVTAFDQDRLSAILGLSVSINSEFSATQLKMSALAGLTVALGKGSIFQSEAYRSLFGDWHTHPDLPENFWRDARVRKRMYQEADVDEGLIAAPPGTALEIMIDSGLAVGIRSEDQAVAVVSFGQISMTVRSKGINKDAFAVIDQFERELRKYVRTKLETNFGRDWFKQRASHLLPKAKRTREDAVKRGESSAPLIEFIDLGDLSNIIKSNNNWDEVFAEVFIDKLGFDQDMQRLIAIRRPAMHARNVDGVRLVEAMCVMNRLSDRMADDGAWKLTIDQDV